MNQAFSAIAIAVSLGFLSDLAAAQPKSDPDWPCVQPKVPELSAVSIWSGPPLDAAQAGWREDKDLAELVAQLASRRVPVEEATAAVSKFAGDLKPAEKAERLTLLFAGLFETLDQERGQIIGSIDRYARTQKGIAEQIRTDQARLSDLNSAGDAERAQALNTQLQTRVRVFNDRQASLSFVCEVPTLIEQRLFSLGRAIQGQIPG